MYVNPCNFSLNPVNTGVDCAAKLSVTAMLYWLPKNRRFTQADIDAAPYNGNLTAFFTAQTLLPPAQRWYPMFGFAAPISAITENNESDVIETLDNGSSVFVRYGKYNRTIITDDGGLCFASHLMRFPNGYSFIEVDQQGQVLWYEPSAGVYGGVPTNMVKGLGPVLATFSTGYKNRLMLSFDPVAYAQYGKIRTPSNDENLLGINGLMDVELSNFSAPVAASNTAPTTGATTVTAIGANGDTIQVSINGTDVSGAVAKTASETTPTLLATKVAAAVTALAATNGGITATSAGAVITYVIPASFGSSINGLTPVATIVGGITATEAAFASGAYGQVTFQVNVKTDCAGTNLVTEYPGTTDPGLVQAANFPTTRGGVTVTPTVTLVSVGGVPDHVQIVVPSSTTATSGVIVIKLGTPVVLDSNGVSGYDGVNSITY